MELDGVPATPTELAALALVNYGHFTTMRVEGGRVRGLELHLERLARDCRTVFDTDLDTDRVRTLARRVAGPADQPVILRVTVFDPALEIGWPGAEGRPKILVTRRPARPGSPPPVRLRSVRFGRELPTVKHTGLFGAAAQRRSAQRAGYDDALFVDPVSSMVSEGPAWNIAFVEGDRVIWPAAKCLPGVTTRLLTETLDRLGIPAGTAPVPREALPGGYAAFVTNAVVGLRPVASVDGAALAEASPLIDALRAGYAAIAGQPL